MTVKEIIKNYLEYIYGTSETTTIANHIIETRIANYAQTRFNIMHAPGTYSRAWRDIRKKRKTLVWEGFRITEEAGISSVEKYFKIERI